MTRFLRAIQSPDALQHLIGTAARWFVEQKNALDRSAPFATSHAYVSDVAVFVVCRGVRGDCFVDQCRHVRAAFR